MAVCLRHPENPTNGGSNQLPKNLWDPNVVGLMNATDYLKQGWFPNPNIVPNAGDGWNNYSFINTAPQNRWEATGKVDYAISENTKLSGSYKRRIETDQHPTEICWEPACSPILRRS